MKVSLKSTTLFDVFFLAFSLLLAVEVEFISPSEYIMEGIPSPVACVTLAGTAASLANDISVTISIVTNAGAGLK